MTSTRIAVMMFGFLWLTAVVTEAAAGCTKDAECKGSRVCVEGKCAALTEAVPAPTPAPAPVPAPAPEPVPVAVPEPQTAPRALEPTAPAPVVTDAPPVVAPVSNTMAPATAGKPGIVVGAVFDLLGYAFVVAGGLVTSNALGAGLGLMYGGSASLTIGSVIGSASYSYRHSRYVKAGFAPRGGPRAAAWVFTGLTLGCAGGSIAMASLAGAEGSLGLAIGSIGLAGGAAIFEIINALAVRSAAWQLALRRAPRTAARPLFFPAVYALPASDTRDLIPAVGLGARF